MSNASSTISEAAHAPQPQAAPWLSWNFAGTVLVSAFLLFQVQPIISKFILPWFGGSPAVWTTCMLFFQVLLFAGYAYAHLLQRLLSPRAQGICHGALLIVALCLLRVTPDVSWKPPDSSEPTWRILQLLGVCVGIPYFALSATGPLLQAWFSRAYPGRSPYRLYALLNVGSLVALLSYPFVFEPSFDVLEQTRMWSIGFWVFAGLCAICAAWLALHHHGESAAAARSADDAAPDAPPSLPRRALWIGLPACASLMLLATTNHVCQDVAVIPFLWVVPLSFYLLTFIICFDHERWYVRPLFCLLAIGSLTVIVGIDNLEEWMTWALRHEMNYVDELVIFFTAMFSVCMVCHGELVRSRPGPRYLTEFYLLISAGGALGGIFVSLIAPEIFSTFFEWKIALALSYMVAIAVIAWDICERSGAPRAIVGALAVPVALLGPALLAGIHTAEDKPIAIARNFYGVVSVWETDANNPETHYRSLRNGRIVHGRQFRDPVKSRQPIAYYEDHTGVGQAMTYLQQRQSVKVGVVGLGVGTMAAYARGEDEFRFYEINPVVLDMANKYFTYLKDCPGKHEVILGDARLALEREPSHGFDLLVLDAFSGDAIPTHLLTREAFEIYLKQLAPDGILAIHITNRYLDLAPVVEGLAKHFDLGLTRIYADKDNTMLRFRSDWMLVTRNKDFLKSHPPKPPHDAPEPHEVRLWTDHYSNLFEILQ